MSPINSGSSFVGRFLQKGSLLMATSAVLLCGSAPTLTGCDRLTESVAVIVGEECARLIREVLDNATNHLPNGFEWCGSSEWQCNDQVVRHCYYCSKHDRSKIYVQQDCEGKYYPVRQRYLGSPTAGTGPIGPSVALHECLTKFTLSSKVKTDEAFKRGAGQFLSPDDRMLPRIAGYTDLTVTINGEPIAGVDDFRIDEGSLVSIEGPIEEVAHYAMIIGIEELSLNDGGDNWEIFLNREACALMAFKNDTFVETRFLFAPSE